MAEIWVINGPNLGMLGQRDPKLYGKESLQDIEALCKKEAEAVGHGLHFVQSDAEAELIKTLHEAKEKAAGVIINAAAYTHTSVAIHDALELLEVPVVEVHLSNIYKREPFRHHSYVSPQAAGIICGFGAESYRLAVVALNNLLKG